MSARGHQELTPEQREAKSRHQKARRAAKRQGYELRAVRTDDGGIIKDPRAPLHGLWELVETESQVVVIRGKMTDVERYLYERPID